jgi:hypothetical protein
MSDYLRRVDDGDLQGACCLAVGADQIFAKAVLAMRGRLHVILPSADYASTFTTDEERATFARLLSSSNSCEELPYTAPTEEAFMAAGRAVADRSDLLLAVWDGMPAAGFGGTGDVVQYARSRGKPVEVIWPVGASRREE